MSVRFFVSYKRKDSDTDRLLPPLRKALEGFRYNVFFKYKVLQDVDIDPGDVWRKALKQNIELAEEFLLLLSAEAEKSPYVQDELKTAKDFWDSKNKKRSANYFWHSKYKQPRLIPVYIKIKKSENPELNSIVALDDIHHLEWNSDADTPIVAKRIRKLVGKRRRLGAIARAAAAVLIIFFVHSMIQIVQIRNARSSAAETLTAYDRLRAAERLLVPRLWLVGGWKPEALIAQALDERAGRMLASPLRNKVDQGLLLSAQAAMLSGAKVTAAAQRVYDEQHYESLVTSIAAGQEIAGRSLAVSSEAAPWRIAIGGRIWTCAQPIGQRPCAIFPRTSRLPVVDAAGFDSQTLRLVGYSGETTTLDLLSGRESSPPVRDATFVAVDQGDIATAFDHGAAGGASVTVDPAGPALGPTNSGDFGRVKMLAFGPCRDCIATRGMDGVVKIWHWSSGSAAGNPRVLPDKALSLAATRSGHRLALINSAGKLVFYGADAKPEGAPPLFDLRDAESMAMSPDGRHLAVVHAGNVTIFDDGAKFRTLIDAKQPRAIAVAFAGNDYLVTRTPGDARIWRLRSTERRDLGPKERLSEWRKKFGLAGAGVVQGKD
jgi:hypothetical protein